METDRERLDEILALEDQRIEAMTNGDAETLEIILADDLIYTLSLIHI